MKQYDIIAFLETWCVKEHELKCMQESLSDYTMYVRYACKTNLAGRASGGVVVFIKSSLSDYIQPLPEKFNFGLAFKALNLCDVPLLLLFTYLPPHGSTAYGDNEVNGILHLDAFVNLIKSIYPEIEFVISGDLNARTQDLPDYIIDDACNYLPVPEFYLCDNFSIPRKSRDLHGDVNIHGKSLLHFCSVNGMHMLNGRSELDSEGNLTCFTSNGSSLVDYTLTSSVVFPLVCKFEIGNYDDFTHLPQLITLSTKLAKDCNTFDKNMRDDDKENVKRTYYTWSNNSYDTMLHSKYILEVEEHLHNDCLDKAVNSFNSLINEACSVKEMRKGDNGKKQVNDWWDDEMSNLKYKKQKLLRKLRKDPNQDVLSMYHDIRKLYKRKIKAKKAERRQRNRVRAESCKSPSDFWKFIKSRAKVKSCVNTITCEEWKIYFEGLLNCNKNLDKNFEEDIKYYMTWHDANCDICLNVVNEDPVNRNITIEEVEGAIDNFVRSKSPGLDGVTNDILKQASVIIVPLLCNIFNKILECKYFPREWSQALIVTLHKKGNVNDPSNYRGISLLSCVGKVFTKIINTRLTIWANENDKVYEVQGGFQKGKSTMDHIFIFQSLVSKYLCKPKGRFYSVFIDFTKAFDSVSHLHLFYTLVQENLHGRVMCTLRDLYSKLYSCVQSSDGNISEFFKCNLGTRQGCMISPILFVFYLNEFIKQVNTNQCPGIYVNELYPNINMLLYADDLVLVGDSVGHVQQLLNNLSDFCNKFGLAVNLEKTNFMVFRNGGIVKANEKVYLNGKRIELAPYYKYLGIIISSRLSWTPAQKTLSQQAEKCFNLINNLNYECDFSFKTCNELFDKCVVPVVTYSSEVWGVNFHECVDDVLLKFCRLQLGVGSKTPLPAILGECGKHSLGIYCTLKCIKYWLKLVHLPDDNLLKSCYNMVLTHCNVGRSNWASNIKSCLYRYGFGYVWENQGVQNIQAFLDEFKMRLIDCTVQTWKNNMSNMPKLRSLRLFKKEFLLEPYLLLESSFKIRHVIAKFRTGSHDLQIEKGRQLNLPTNERYCKLCLSINVFAIEDEYHVLLQCTFYESLRNTYLDLANAPVNLYTFISIMSSEDLNNLTKLGIFLFNMFKVRRLLLQSL